MKRSSYLIATGVAELVMAAATSMAEGSKKPNIILMMVDMGCGDTGFNVSY